MRIEPPYYGKPEERLTIIDYRTPEPCTVKLEAWVEPKGWVFLTEVEVESEHRFRATSPRECLRIRRIT